ncbi:MAG: WD40 repeat domain-containing protein [Lewinellaceae bacterium]|nr:WD40 repeat domain-containing protein [Lewinellaceae bacterium]
MRHFLLFFSLLVPSLLFSQTEETRCRYRPSREFLLSRNDSCYQITGKEADRAFSLRCWDEAMALYRAAKSCADANQTARSLMNRRIQACRDSSEQELRQSELQARRQFLHAAAANLADDAEERLKDFDRSFAYRLAEFAGEYIAPGPNADCTNTLLEAWYYVPPVQPGTAGYQDLQVPFCYQLDYDLGGNVQVRFGGTGKYRRLYAFAPASRQLLSWEAETMKPGPGMQVEDGFTGFDISPDGWTLMFYSDKNILFWRSTTEVFRVTASKIGSYCFSPSGSEFLYFDKNESKIYALNMRDVFAQRKGGQRPGPQVVLQNPPFEVLGMASYKGRIWLGGPDSLVVLKKGEKETPWSPEKSLPWGLNAGPYVLDLKIMPERQTAFFIRSDSIVRVPLVLKAELPESAGPGISLRGAPLSIRQDASLAAFFNAGADKNLLYVLTADAGAMRHGTYLQPDDRFNLMSGSFSHDGRWFAAATDTGTVKLWALTELRNDSATTLRADGEVIFSQNGDQFAFFRNDTLKLYETERPAAPFFSLITPIPENAENILVRATGKNWVAYQTRDRTLIVKNGLTGKTCEFATRFSVENEEIMAAISPDDQLIAFMVRSDSMVICSLENGEAQAGRSINGVIKFLDFIPNSNSVMFVQEDLLHGLFTNQVIAKIWNYTIPNQKELKTLRLHDYNIEFANVSASGDQVAFSNGEDIRVFHLDNPLDESIRIRPNETQNVEALAFHPDGSALVAGYSDGLIIVWDLASGEPRFSLQTQSGRWGFDRLSFSNDGSLLRIKDKSNYLFFRNIDPDQIRATAQTEFLRLLAFTPEQIQSKGLEKALNYSGNFQRLAESGDLPLIRSFFEYYRKQVLASNNIDQVRSYFTSASRLYSKLGDGSTQRALLPTMYEIYEDFIWKLLLREKNEEAVRVSKEFYKVLDNPLPAFKSGAYTSLMRNDFHGTAQQFAEWTIRMFDDPAVQPDFWQVLYNLRQNFQQLKEYNLLDQPQVDCLCGIYAKIMDINDLCAHAAVADKLPLDVETRLRWNIFQNQYLSSGTTNRSVKTRLLESAFSDATALYRRNMNTWRGQLENTTLKLAQAYTEQGVFEQGNTRSESAYRQAIRLLDSLGRFKTEEQARQKALINNHLKLGDYFLSINNLEEAGKQYESGITTGNELLTAAPADSVATYRNNLLAPLYSGLGMVQLLHGKTDVAGNTFRQAYDAYTYGLFAYYFGHIALMEGKEDEAIRQYREIYSAQQMSDALFTISRLAARFPEQRARVDAFVPVFRKAVLEAHPDILPDEVDYLYAQQKSAYASANEQWADALAWNEKSLALAEKLADQPEVSEQAKPAAQFHAFRVVLPDSCRKNRPRILLQGDRCGGKSRSIRGKKCLLLPVQRLAAYQPGSCLPPAQQTRRPGGGNRVLPEVS